MSAGFRRSWEIPVPFYPFGDLPAIASAIDELVESPELAQRWVRAGGSRDCEIRPIALFPSAKAYTGAYWHGGSPQRQRPQGESTASRTSGYEFHYIL
jgi:hypothetical protein